MCGCGGDRRIVERHGPTELAYAGVDIILRDQQRTEVAARAATNRHRRADEALMYLMVARCQLHLHDAKRAEIALQRATRCHPHFNHWYLSAGVFDVAIAIKYEQGHDDEARRLWEGVLAEGPRDDQALAAHNLSCYWADRGDERHADRYRQTAAARRRWATIHSALALRRLGLSLAGSRLRGGAPSRGRAIPIRIHQSSA